MTSNLARSNGDGTTTSHVPIINTESNVTSSISSSSGISTPASYESGQNMEPIAIVGMSCRLPGSANNPEDFWEMLKKGRTAWTPGPGARFNMKAFQDHHGETGETMNVRGAHFLKGDISAFDAGFFGLNQLEVKAMDPQHRLLLEIAFESFENAGMSMESLWGSNTGVYVGQWVSDYHEIATRDTSNLPKYLATGTGPAISSNRISYFYNLHGPSFTVDTGCSSSLVALHQAIHSLRSGEASQCFVGGVNLLLDPQRFVYQSKLSLLSSEGRSFAFDSRAAGYGRGEGCTGVVIKPLSAAIRDDDSIRAVIRNTSVTQDGRTPGIAVPSASAQVDAIARAYRPILGDPEADYIEAHGTGTQVGDPIEAGAIAQAFGPRKLSTEALPIGSVKANIGHTEAAAGLASLIKSVLMLEHGMIPPQANFITPNPKLLLDEWKIRIPTKLETRDLRRISVNSFGYGGTNAHVVLEKAPGVPPLLSSSTTTTTEDEETQRVFFISAASEKSCQALCGRLIRYVGTRRESSSSSRSNELLSRLAYTLGKLSVHSHRLAIVAPNVEKLIQQLNAAEQSPIVKSERRSKTSVGFIFTGQGAQYANMGRELLRHSTFRRSMEQASQQVARLGCPWDLLEELRRGGDESRINEPTISQPACTAIQLALVDLLAEYGISPCAVVGHSSGEIAAAYAVGALSFDHAMAVSYFRGKVTSDLLAERPPGAAGGAMLAVGASPEAIQESIQKLGTEHGRMGVACFNSPRSLTVSGDAAAIDALKADLDQAGTFNRKLKTNGAAYHSHHMEAVADQYIKCLAGLATDPAQDRARSTCRFFSSVSGKELSDLSELTRPDYWAKNLLSPVLFTQAVTQMDRHEYQGGHVDVVMELGPHSQLGGPVKQIFQDMGGKQRPPIEYMSSLVRGKDGEVSLLESLAQLHIRGGLSLPLHRLGHYDPVRTPKQLVDLPLYPFDHEKTFWHNTRVNKNYAHRKYPPHELLGTLSPEANKLEPRWRQFLSLKRLSWLKGHVVQRQLIFPAAGYLTMALQALHQHRRAQDPAVRIESMLLRNVSIVKALLLNEDGPDVEIALSLRPQPKCASASSSHWDEFRIFSVTGEDERWTEHCRGLIGVGNELNGGGLGGKEWWTAEEEGELELQEARCSRQVKSSQFYTLSQRLGFHWQHPFDSVSGLRTAAGACVATATAAPPDTGTTGTGGGLGNIWPVGLLDSCMFQGFFASLAFDGGVTSPTVPTFITEMRVSTNKPMAAGRTVRSTSVASTENPYAYDVAIRDDNGGGEPLIVARGINFIRLPDEAANLGGESGNVCYNVDWVPYVSAWKVEGPRKICGRTSEPSHCIDQVAEYCRALGRQTPRLKALGIGAGMTAAARPILQAVNGGSGDGDRYLARFDVSGLSQEDFESVKEECGNPLADVLGFRDLEDFQQQQGLQDGASDDDGGEYDVVLVSGQEVDSVLAGARQVLKPGGKLLLLATTRSPPHFDLEKAGFQDPQLCFEDCPAADDGTMGVFIATRPWLAASPTSEVLRIDLVTHDACRLNDTSTIDKTLPEAQVSAHSLSGPTPESANMVVLLPEVAKYLCASPSQSSWQAFKNWVLRARTVLFVGTGYSTEADSSSSAIWTGLARCLRLEHPHIRFVTIQFSQQGGGDVSEKIAQWLPVLLQRTSAFDLNRPGHETENEFLERDSQLYVSRLFPHRENSEYIRSMHHQSPPVPTPFFDENRTTMAAELGVTGLLDSIRWKPTTTGTPVVVGPDEVRLELRAASINFKDVLIAAGQLPGITQMRNDCSGIVVEVGANMRGRFQLGDRVMALYSDSYTNYPVVHGDCCHVVPENLSFEEAASVPIVWATVYYSLVDMGRLAKGDKILIHSAAGAVGQAAIMLAMDIGAEVFATVSSDDKVNLLVDQFGIPRDHIFSSRTGAFLSGIRRATGGRGVDVVLNSLSGEMFRHSCNVLAPFGRFVEIGRKELMDDALMPMAFMLKNITFAYVDMALIIDINKPLAQRVLGDVVRMLAADAGSSIRPVALTTFPISEIETAFRHIQAGKHTGKIILKVEDGQEVKALPRPPLPPTFQPNATYAVVGGFGGIGKASIEWLASHGAKEILCISRSGAKTQENQDFVKSMEDRGVRLTAVKCDVASKDEVASIARQFKEENRPIRGIIQSSVVFEDGLFEDMTVESWQNVMNPKVRGTANLHKHFQSSDIDFFVIMSSVVSMTGNDGQTNYAAACCFQDELMRQRTASGLHGFSINVGPVLEVGHLAEHAAVARQLRRRGFEPISIQQVLSMLSYAISHQPRVDDPDSSVCAVSYKPCPENGGDAQKRGLRFSHLIGDESSTGSQNNGGAQGGNEGNISDRLDEAPTLESAIEIICTAVLKQLGKLIATPAETLNLELSLDHYGVDSLIGVEMRNWLIAYLRTDLPLMTIRSTGSIKELAGLVAKESPMVGSY